MKKLLTAILLVLGITFDVLAGSLRVVANQWPPYVDQSMPQKGMAIEIVEAAFKRAGYQHTIRIETWTRALEGLEIGIYDVAGAVWKTPEREKILIFSDPYWINQIKFIKKKGLKADFNNLGNLSGYLIGTLRDYAYDEAFVNSKTLIKIPQNHMIQNLLKLRQGDIDITLGDENAIRYELNQYMKGSISEFEFLQKPLASRGLHIAVSKQNTKAAKIIADFNQVIRAMKADGSFDTIVKKYHFPEGSE